MAGAGAIKLQADRDPPTGLQARLRGITGHWNHAIRGTTSTPRMDMLSDSTSMSDNRQRNSISISSISGAGFLSIALPRRFLQPIRQCSMASLILVRLFTHTLWRHRLRQLTLTTTGSPTISFTIPVRGRRLYGILTTTMATALGFAPLWPGAGVLLVWGILIAMVMQITCCSIP